jgi:N-acetylglucosaminyldiphosphoundecaprenol N-acetyl-beta-D-mannosaminyltransferase
MPAASLFSVLGLPIHLIEDYPGWLVDRLHQQKGCHVVTLNAEMTMQAEHNPPLAEIIHQAELVIPDGAGVVLYLKLHGKHVTRCPGIELSEALLKQSAQFNTELQTLTQNSLHPSSLIPHPSFWSVLFYGGAPGVAEQAAEVLQKRMPGLEIVGTQHGYLTPEDEPIFLKMLQTLQPRLIFVGLGVPRQELWIAQHRHLCPDAVWVGVGGSFDIWAGTKSRAPAWLADNHLEWLYRLYQEPWRWRRMLALPKFAGRAIVYRLTKKNPVSKKLEQ